MTTDTVLRKQTAAIIPCTIIAPKARCPNLEHDCEGSNGDNHVHEVLVWHSNGANRFRRSKAIATAEMIDE